MACVTCLTMRSVLWRLLALVATCDVSGPSRSLAFATPILVAHTFCAVRLRAAAAGTLLAHSWCPPTGSDCDQETVASLATGDATSIVIDLLLTNPNCGKCLLACGQVASSEAQSSCTVGCIGTNRTAHNSLQHSAPGLAIVSGTPSKAPQNRFCSVLESFLPGFCDCQDVALSAVVLCPISSAALDVQEIILLKAQVSPCGNAYVSLSLSDGFAGITERFTAAPPTDAALPLPIRARIAGTAEARIVVPLQLSGSARSIGLKIGIDACTHDGSQCGRAIANSPLPIMIFEGCFDFAAACSSVYSELGGDSDTNSMPNPCEIMAGGLPDVVPPAAMAIGSKGMALAASKFNLALGSLDAGSGDSETWMTSSGGLVSASTVDGSRGGDGTATGSEAGDSDAGSGGTMIVPSAAANAAPMDLAAEAAPDAVEQGVQPSLAGATGKVVQSSVKAAVLAIQSGVSSQAAAKSAVEPATGTGSDSAEVAGDVPVAGASKPQAQDAQVAQDMAVKRQPENYQKVTAQLSAAPKWARPSRLALAMMSALLPLGISVVGRLGDDL